MILDIDEITDELVGPARIVQACVSLHGYGTPTDPDRFIALLAGLPSFVALRKDVEALIGPCELDMHMSW